MGGEYWFLNLDVQICLDLKNQVTNEEKNEF